MTTASRLPVDPDARKPQSHALWIDDSLRKAPATSNHCLLHRALGPATAHTPPPILQEYLQAPPGTPPKYTFPFIELRSPIMVVRTPRTPPVLRACVTALPRGRMLHHNSTHTLHSLAKSHITLSTRYYVRLQFHPPQSPRSPH
jgi:hypothetical protein